MRPLQVEILYNNYMLFNWNFENFAGSGLLLLIIWEAFWKLIGLWKAAKQSDKLWFVAIFVVNFFGLIPIIYLWKTKQLESTLHETLKFLRFKKQ